MLRAVIASLFVASVEAAFKKKESEDASAEPSVVALAKAMPMSHLAAFLAGCVFTLVCVGCANMKLLDADPYCFGDGAPPASATALVVPRRAATRVIVRARRQDGRMRGQLRPLKQAREVPRGAGPQGGLRRGRRAARPGRRRRRRRERARLVRSVARPRRAGPPPPSGESGGPRMVERVCYRQAAGLGPGGGSSGPSARAA